MKKIEYYRNIEMGNQLWAAVYQNMIDDIMDGGVFECGYHGEQQIVGLHLSNLSYLNSGRHHMLELDCGHEVDLYKYLEEAVNSFIDKIEAEAI